MSLPLLRTIDLFEIALILSVNLTSCISTRHQGTPSYGYKLDDSTRVVAYLGKDFEATEGLVNKLRECNQRVVSLYDYSEDLYAKLFDIDFGFETLDSVDMNRLGEITNSQYLLLADITDKSEQGIGITTISANQLYGIHKIITQKSRFERRIAGFYISSQIDFI